MGSQLVRSSSRTSSPCTSMNSIRSSSAMWSKSPGLPTSFFSVNRFNSRPSSSRACLAALDIWQMRFRVRYVRWVRLAQLHTQRKFAETACACRISASKTPMRITPRRLVCHEPYRRRALTLGPLPVQQLTKVGAETSRKRLRAHGSGRMNFARGTGAHKPNQRAKLLDPKCFLWGRDPNQRARRLAPKLFLSARNPIDGS